jgi:hypothetical protein
MSGCIERAAKTIKYPTEQVPARRHQQSLSRRNQLREGRKSPHFPERRQNGDIALNTDDLGGQLTVIFGIAEFTQIPDTHPRSRRTDDCSNDLKDTTTDIHRRRLLNRSARKPEEPIDAFMRTTCGIYRR